MRYSSIASLAVSVVVVVAHAEQTPLSESKAVTSEEQHTTPNVPTCPDPGVVGMEVAFGQQFEFRCEDSPTGTIAAKCCPVSSILPDGKGTFQVKEGCWSTYHHNEPEMDGFTWLPGFVRDYVGLRREAVQEGWKTWNNCGSGYDHVKGLCCKSNPTPEQMMEGADWSADCSLPTAWGVDGLQSAPPVCIAVPPRDEDSEVNDLEEGRGTEDWESHWESHYGEQHTFDCEPEVPGPLPGSIAAMCCSASDLVPDGEGTFKAAHGCSGTYHGGIHTTLSPRWLAERGLDWIGERLGLQEGPSYGWSTRENCGSGYDGRRGMCCKNVPRWYSGGSWASDCVPPTTFVEKPDTSTCHDAAHIPFEEEPDVLKTDTAFSCKSVEVGFRSPGGQTAICCPPSANVVPEDDEGRYRVDTPGCKYAVNDGWLWRVFGNDNEAEISTMNDCGPPSNGWTKLCCNTMSYRKPNGVAEEVGDCVFAPPRSV